MTVPTTTMLMLAAAAAMLAGCGATPRGGEVLTVAVSRTHPASDAQHPRFGPAMARARALGLSDADIAAGRIVYVYCGLGSDHQWGSLAVVPAGVPLPAGGLWTLRVEHNPTNDHEALNPLLQPVRDFPGPVRMPAYAVVPDWRERGLSSNLRPLPLEPAQRGRYVEIHSHHVIACRQPG